MSNYTEFGIFMTLLDGKLHKATELAEAFEISTKTVYRQTNKLVYAGFPITTLPGKNGGILLASKYNCLTWFFTEEELAYMLSIMSSNSKVAPGLSEVICSKLKQHIIQKGLSVENKTSAKIYVDNSRWCQQTNNYYNLTKPLAEACTKNKKLTICYDSNEAPRLVDPYCIVLKDANYYLYAFCNKRNDFRLFRLDRINSWQKSEIDFNKQDINLSSKPWNNTSFSKIKITIIAERKIINDISSWCQTKELGESSCVIEATHNLGLIHKLIEYGDKIKIISPRSIIDEIKNECNKVIDLYK